MMPKGQRTSLEERIRIGEMAKAGRSSQEIGETLGRPLSTVQKWRQKYKREGRDGLISRMGRPPKGALGSAPDELKDRLLELRKEHTGWGALTLRLEIAKDERFTGLKIPSRSRIAAYLKEHKQVRKYEHHEPMPGPLPQGVTAAHEEWELDTMGVVNVAGIGKVAFVDIVDVYSHVGIDSHAYPKTSHPGVLRYQQVLRRAFARRGLPEKISLDHDIAFFDNQCASPFPTRFHLWLIGLGIEVRFIEKKPPLEHARIERYHQIIAHQVVGGHTYADLGELERTLQARILFLNSEYPSRASKDQPPLVAFPQAGHSIRFYSPEEEPQLFNIQRVYDYLQKGRWFRSVAPNGIFSLGGQNYNAGRHFADHTLEITFDATMVKLVCVPQFGLPKFYLPPQGLLPSTLIGDIDSLPASLATQLSLPWVTDTTL